MDDFDIFRLDGHAMRVFASVCETESFSRAAEIFGLNQSTISHQVDKMRAALGDPLFVKSGRGIVPTEKALALLPRIQWILAEIEGLAAPEQYLAAVDSRPLVISIPTPAVMQDVRALYAELQKVVPEAELHVRRLAPRTRLNDMLAQDEADLAISVAGLRYPTTLNSCHYGQDELLVFYDPAMRGPVNTVADYGKARHAVVNFGGGVRSVVDEALAAAGHDRRIALVAPTASTLGELIKGTDVIATMPRRLAHLGAYQGIACCPPPLPLPVIRYDLVWHRRYENSARNGWFRQIVQQVGAQVYGQLA